ncbi:MAG: LacI family transcriptional regulator, partial [Prevotella sp.]|nr:LacI family transcriptional regulator [Prevotella sp.]
SVIMDQAQTQGYKACELLIRRIQGDRRVYKEIVPFILKFRESSEKSHIE